VSLFIAIEGIDCSGKKVQSELLAAALGAELFSFPDYSTESGKVLRSYLDRKWHVCDPQNELNSYVETFAYQSFQTLNRLEKVPAIQKALKYGDVVADRWTKSGEVYGPVFGLDKQYIHDVQVTLPRPHLNILLDIDWETSVKRKPKKRDVYEASEALMRAASNQYKKEWEGHTWHGVTATDWQVIDGNKSIDEVHREILLLVKNRLEFMRTYGK